MTVATKILPNRRPAAQVAPQSQEEFLTIEIIRDKWGMERIRNEWTHVTEKSNASVFQTIEWQQLWWKHFGGARVLHILLFRHHGMLVGIAPFFIQHDTLAGFDCYSSLRLIGSPGISSDEGIAWCSDGKAGYLDIMAIPEYEHAVVHTVLNYLSNHADLYDELSLERVPADSLIVRKLLPALEDLKWKFARNQTAASHRIHLPMSVDALTESMPSITQFQFEQARRIVTHWRVFVPKTVDTLDGLENVLQVLDNFRRNGADRNGQLHVLLNGNNRSFLKESLLHFMQKGWLWLTAAYNGEQCVAVECVIMVKGIVYECLNAVDRQSPLARRMPDRALFYAMLEEAIQRNFKVVDLMNTLDEYRMALAGERMERWNIIVENPGQNVPLRSKLYRAQRWLSANRIALVRRGIAAFEAAARVLRSRVPMEREAPTDGDLDQRELENEKSGQTRPAELQITVVDNEEGFRALQQEWEDLVNRAEVRVYQTFDWQWLWWKYFGHGQQLHIIVLRNGDRLVGIVPLFREERTLFGIRLRRRLKFLGSGVRKIGGGSMMSEAGPSDYLDVIFSKEVESECARVIVQYLREHPGAYDEIEFDNVPPESIVARVLLPCLMDGGIPLDTHQSDVCPYLAVPSSFQEYLKKLDSSVSHRLQQAMKTFDDKPPYSIETVTEQSLSRAFAELVVMHQKRWNRLGYPGLFSVENFTRFQAEIAARFQSKGQLWFKTVQFSGVRIAARLGFIFKGRLYDYLTGFDEDMPGANRRPGLALLMRMIEDAMAKGVSVVDFLRGDEKYKFELASGSSRNVTVTIVNPVTRGAARSILLTLLHAADVLVRKLTLERALINVQRTQHGWWKCVPRYAAFRFSRLIQKYLPNAVRKKAERPEIQGGSWKFNELAVVKALQRTSLFEEIAESLSAGTGSSLTTRLAGTFVRIRSLVLARLYLRTCNALGRKTRTVGRPWIRNGGRMEFGESLVIDSRIVRTQLVTDVGSTLRIGNRVTIGMGTSICARNSITIGNNVQIGQHVSILDSEIPVTNERKMPLENSVVIEDDVQLGSRVIVLKGTRIGKGTIVMTGSVVSGNIPPNVVVGGIPGRVVRAVRLGGKKERRRNGGQGMASVPEGLRDRVAAIVKGIFLVPGVVELSSGPGDFSSWDTFGHLRLLGTIEKEFGVSFSDDDVLELNSVGDFCACVQKKLGQRDHDYERVHSESHA